MDNIQNKIGKFHTIYFKYLIISVSFNLSKSKEFPMPGPLRCYHYAHPIKFQFQASTIFSITQNPYLPPFKFDDQPKNLITSLFHDSVVRLWLNLASIHLPTKELKVIFLPCYLLLLITRVHPLSIYYYSSVHPFLLIC